MKKISLTGIKPTGTPHLGNYLGAIRPALELSKTYDTVYFIADYHALTTVQNGAEMRANIYKIAATWLALGLNPEEGLFYKQSDIPEIFELSWALSCFTPKGFMNRAHAYKDKVAKNEAAGEDPDANVNMGLYCYPCLMDADILMFSADIVPVGKDQKQHVEFARDIAIKFNKHFGEDVFTIPEPVFQETTGIIPGLDGRKMSKSYDNVIDIFLESKALKKKIGKIVTNSQGILATCSSCTSCLPLRNRPRRSLSATALAAWAGATPSRNSRTFSRNTWALPAKSTSTCLTTPKKSTRFSRTARRRPASNPRL